ncbi:Protein STRUBBELIG-RECEPTOR FAMILY 6 [Acorus gramineus]|uniref:Protein STRUBBELIG-RECEPTOR FAMILY 6 n=1 Tax=Acorus gramineus TaxID=55184 RepID=A0AAV9BVD3_ACOGR|nr:Protein STRUBBELIG-RECEPTOR FAMILY 6 [Acorus gramineus]
MLEEIFLALVCISVLNPICIDGTTDQSDVSSLTVLYSSLNSASQLTGWSPNGGDPCGKSWKGITCSGSSVTEMDISGNTFSGAIPYSISQMTPLQYLNLGHNQLQGNLTDMFGSLPNIASLDLSFNSFTGDLPESFSSLSRMNSMYLQNNQFTGPIDVLANLPLQNLNVANNHFSGWIPDQLKRINNIQTDGNSWFSGPAPPPPPYTPPPPGRSSPGQRSGGSRSPSNSNGGGKSSGIGGGGIAGIVISILVVSAIVAFFLLKRRSKKSLDEEKLGQDRPFTPLPSNEVQELKSVQIASSVDTMTSVPAVPMTLKPPPIDRHKSFDEDDLSNKPVVKRVNNASITAMAYSVADLQMATGSFSIDNLIGEGSIGRVYRAQFDDGKLSWKREYYVDISGCGYHSGRVLAVKKINSSAFLNQSSEEFLEVVSIISRLHHSNITELVGYCSEYGQHLLVYEFHKNGSLHDFLHLSDEYTKPLTWNARVKIALGSARALEYLHEVCSPSVVHKNFKSANILLDMELNPHLSDSGLETFLTNAEHQASNLNMGSGYSAPEMVDPALEGLYPVKSLSRFADVIALCVQPEPEFRPPMSEVVQALVRLVQRANMSKRTTGDRQEASRRTDDSDIQD